MPKSFAIGQVVQCIHKPPYLDKNTGETRPESFELQILENDKRADGQDSYNLVRVSAKVDYRHLVGQHIKAEVNPWNIAGRVGWYIPRDVTPQAK